MPVSFNVFIGVSFLQRIYHYPSGHVSVDPDPRIPDIYNQIPVQGRNNTHLGSPGKTQVFQALFHFTVSLYGKYGSGFTHAGKSKWHHLFHRLCVLN
jgi:hypothetical protein